MAIQENDIGLVSFNEFNEHQNNTDNEILHVTQEEKDGWDSKAGGSELQSHKNNITLDHPDESVTKSKIADGAVGKSKLDAELSAEMDGLKGHTTNKSNPHETTKTQVGLGNVDNVKQASQQEFAQHQTGKVLDHPDSSVTTPKIADGAIIAGKIADGNITNSKLGTGAVTTPKIADSNVTTAKLGAGAVTTDKIADKAITSEKIGSGEVESTNIKTGAVVTGKIADEAVTPAKLSEDVINDINAREKAENKGQAGGYAPLDTAGKIPNEYLYGQTIKEYGVRWKGTSSTACDRLGDAVGLVANAHLGTEDAVVNDFDNIYPWSEMRLCNIDTEGNILAFADEPAFARDGTNGDVMVKIPKFYYKRVVTEEGYNEWWVCGVKLPGYELHPLFYDDGNEVSEVFHSAYNASTFTDEADGLSKLRSITGDRPTVRTTRATFRTRARNKGAGWGIEDISCVNALHILYLVEYASTHSQAKLGNGESNLSYTANHKALQETENGNEIVISYSYKSVYRVGQQIEIGTSQGSNNKSGLSRTVTAVTSNEEDGTCTITFDGDPITIAVGNMIWNVASLNGSCDALNGGSGYIGTNGYADTAYRGIEGFHGKVFRFIDGVNIKDHVVHYANSMADYADGVYDGKYRAVGYENAKANGYGSAFGYDQKAPWVMFPTEAKGGSTTYLCDYYYQATGERLLLLGGNFSYGATGGAFCFYCYGAFSGSNLYCGARLLIKKP